jgi:hypothetical protein
VSTDAFSYCKHKILILVIAIVATACSSKVPTAADGESAHTTQAISTSGLSTVSLQLQVLTNSCGENQPTRS